MGYLANKGGRAHAGPGGRPAWNERGVTLVELLFAITGPCDPDGDRDSVLPGCVAAGRLSAISSDLYTSVQLARSEAIKSNATTTLCTSSDGPPGSSRPGDRAGSSSTRGGNVIQSRPAVPTGTRSFSRGLPPT